MGVFEAKKAPLQGTETALIRTPGRIRTCDHRLRRPVLYPAELLVLIEARRVDLASPRKQGLPLAVGLRRAVRPLAKTG